MKIKLATHKLLLFYYTIIPITFRQLYSLLSLAVKSSSLKRLIVKKVKKMHFNGRASIFQLVKKPYVDHQHNLSNKTFVFLNHTEHFESYIEWNRPNLEKLWIYHLHYFNYLLDLTNHVNEENYLKAKTIINDWMENNRIGYGNGWEPYPISLRIVNWIFFYQLYKLQFSSDQKFEVKFMNSLYQQCHYLTNFIEYHLKANHLLANAKALYIAGMFFENRKWLEKGSTILRGEIKEQILSDGGHFERSPMYHAVVLEDILDLINFSRFLKDKNCSLEVSMLTTKAEQMLSWLASVVHPDGNIPLFGDSALNSALNLSQLIDYFGKIREKSVSQTDLRVSDVLDTSGYFIFRTDNQFLIVDGGELGVAYQPGHAHCDLLSYEYSYSGYRFIIDTGVGNYLISDMRQKARSIYAHNTVVINNMDQAELWHAFRMARRVKPENTRYYADSEEIRFEGEYINNLMNRFKYKHKRILLLKKKRFFYIEDHIEASTITSVESLVHIHPAAEIKVNNNIISISRDNRSIGLLFGARETEVKIGEWFYVPEFGQVVNSKVIVLFPKVENNPILSYIISPLSQITQAQKFYYESTKDGT